MKILLIGLFICDALFSCKAQSNSFLNSNKGVDSFQYFSDSCNLYLDYTRQYLNDSIFIETHYDVIDTFLLNNKKLYRLHYGSKYLIVDYENDFKNNQKMGYHHFFVKQTKADTVITNHKSYVVHKIKMLESVSIFVPAYRSKFRVRDIYVYYNIGNCYPLNKECIDYKIKNKKYALYYFDEKLGFIGFSNSICAFLITEKSYKKIKKMVMGRIYNKYKA